MSDVDLSALKAVVAKDGEVWFLSGSGRPRRTGGGAEDFMAARLWARSSLVRVVGEVRSSQLLVRLRGERLSGLQVCSPLCCHSAADRDNPEALLQSMRRCSLPASTGGWHEFTSLDLPSYLLAAHYSSGGDACPETAAWLQAHPVWPALSFVAGLDLTACELLLAELLDPRWYIDPDKPDRGAKWRKFLGLDPRLQTIGHTRYEVLKGCWSGGTRIPAFPVGKYPPRRFPWRAWAARGGGPTGELAASRLFATYLRLVWLDAIAGPKRGRLFLPQDFFRREDERAAFMSHAAAC